LCFSFTPTHNYLSLLTTVISARFSCPRAYVFWVEENQAA
jgi:hypothetical protein